MQTEEVLAEDLFQVGAMTLLDGRIVLGGRQRIEAGDDSTHERRSRVGCLIMGGKVGDSATALNHPSGHFCIIIITLI